MEKTRLSEVVSQLQNFMGEFQPLVSKGIQPHKHTKTKHKKNIPQTFTKCSYPYESQAIQQGQAVSCTWLEAIPNVNMGWGTSR